MHSTTHKNDDLLSAAIHSLLNQSRKPDEYVFVLDECHDNTIRVVRDAMRMEIPEFVKIHQRPKKEGLAAAKNFGMQFCTGDFTTYCDADDEWVQCKLEIQEQFLEANPTVDFCGTESWDRTPDGVIRPNCFHVGQYQTHEQIVDRLPHENVLCHGSMAIRTTALKAMGYNHILGKEDWDLWVRAAYAGYNFYKIPERLYVWSAGTSVAR